MRTHLLAALLLVSCKKDAPRAPSPPPPPDAAPAVAAAPTCDAAIRHDATIVATSPSEEEVVLVVGQCERAGWSEEIRRCLAAAAEERDLAACPEPEVSDDEPLGHMESIAKAAGAVAAMDGDFPKGTVGPTPAGSCCAGTDGTCDDPKAWDDPLWHQLDFGLTEPHRFRYTYDSDGMKLAITATGDLDCDGTEVSYRLDCRLAEGELACELAQPEGAD
jgi:hypothetical protein